MLKKLKRKFVLINMCLVGIVLLVVFSVVCYNTYTQAKQEVDRALEMALNDTMEDKAMPLEIGGQKLPETETGGKGGEPGPGGEEDFYKKAFNYAAVVVYTEEGEDGSRENTTVGNQMVFMDDETLDTAVDQVAEQGEDSGKLPELDLFYSKTSSGDGEKIAFADSSYFDASVSRSIVTAVVLFLLGMLMMFFISLLLSRLAVAPVRKAWKQQQQFVADASHELKTPLTVILANNDILMVHEEEKVKDQKKWIESTQEEALHMKNLIDDMLFLAQSDEDMERLRLVKGRVNLSDLVTEVSLQFEPVIFEKNVTMETDIADDLEIEGDETQMKQLVHILLDNAAKYSQTQGRIFLRLFKSGSRIKLLVANTGAVVEKEDLEHLFERFYRSDKARTREGGYGLGLSIAKNIVERHDGKIDAKSGDLCRMEELSSWKGLRAQDKTLLVQDKKSTGEAVEACGTLMIVTF
ncbi:MAG: HAMP domain-containing sensor histidine kinase, partial [Bacillota bacterium]|nr:HAMP domain-containing sensor histidine kinase [Bacillota bacterium]